MFKADTHEGFCPLSMIQGHAPGAKLFRVYQQFRGAPREQNFHPTKCSTIFKRLNIWEQAPGANWANLKTLPRVYWHVQINPPLFLLPFNFSNTINTQDQQKNVILGGHVFGLQFKTVTARIFSSLKILALRIHSLDLIKRCWSCFKHYKESTKVVLSVEKIITRWYKILEKFSPIIIGTGYSIYVIYVSVRDTL